MEENKFIDLIIKDIKSALGDSNAKQFEIKCDDVIEDESLTFTALFSLKLKKETFPLNKQEFEPSENEHIIEIRFEKVGEESFMILGDDADEFPLTTEGIFKFLYWDEATLEKNEESVIMPKKLTAENGAKGLLSGEFFETVKNYCPECLGEGSCDEVVCEDCKGLGHEVVKVMISWTNIKAIYDKAVDKLAL